MLKMQSRMAEYKIVLLHGEKQINSEQKRI